MKVHADVFFAGFSNAAKLTLLAKKGGRVGEQITFFGGRNPHGSGNQCFAKRHPRRRPSTAIAFKPQNIKPQNIKPQKA
jgi:hypothetical protein